MLILLAFIPIALILILMIGFRWGAAQAGGAGYLSALAIALLFFGGTAEIIAYAHARAFMLSIDVLYIIWAAFLLYRVADEAGAIRVIGQFLPHLTADRGMQALIIGWVFASFLQGVGGFGVPVAVIAPIMVGLGFTPLSAAVIPSIGHAWGVTFGSLGSSFQALMSATGLPAEQLAPASALFLSIAGLAGGLMVAHVAGGWDSVQRLFGPILGFGVTMGAVHFLVAVTGFWNIAAFVGGLAGLIIAFPVTRSFNLGQKKQGSTIQSSGISASQAATMDKRALVIALSGYAALVVITLGIQLVPLVNELLGRFAVWLEFPEVQTSLGFITPAGASRKIRVFNHAGAILLYASILAYLIYRRANLYQPGAINRILSGTVKRVMSSSVSIASMVAMAVIMENSGMTDTLARGLAEGMGRIFPGVAPWIGALGAFMTGSNTNSNVVFGALQLRTAQLLGFNAALILAGQTAGAALASVLAPTKVVVGASTAGMVGQEGDIMRKLLVYIGLLLLLVSTMTVAGIMLTR